MIVVVELLVKRCSHFFQLVVGGLSSEVGLYDLRFLGESSKIVKTYRPSCFDPGEDVAVSGIDISKDRKELLVSYENDQIYTFPVFPSHATDPSVDEMLSLSKVHEDQSESKKIHHNHFAGYGGHLNRFTFLKVSGVVASAKTINILEYQIY